MPLVCPQCHQIYDQHNICPLCNVVLLYHAQSLQNDSGSSIHQEDELAQWQQTPWGKIVIGLILAQGLSHGLRQLLTAGFLAGDSGNVWDTLMGIVLLHAVHGVALLIGGAVTGAGQSRGILYGALVGFTNGVLTFLLLKRMSEASGTMLVFAEPLMHLAVGGLGGALGMLVWRPAPTIPELAGSTTPVPRLDVGLGLGNMFVGPIHMGRICAGAFLVVVGVVWSKAIMEFLLRASNGTFNITSHLQAQLVSMEISGLVALLGAAFAGATTSNGLKQGLCVGLGASVVVLGVQLSSPQFLMTTLITTLAGTFTFTLVGGWLGGQLFPPVLPGRRRRPFSTY